MNGLRAIIIKISNLFFRSYTESRNLYNGNSACYCGSEKKYFKCCKPINDNNRKIAIQIVRKYEKRDNHIIKVKIIRNGSHYAKSFTPGDINPLNRGGNYNKINIGDNGGVDSGN